MKRRTFLLGCAAAVAGGPALGPAASAKPDADGWQTVERPDLLKLFAAAGTEGTMIVRDLAAKRVTLVGAARADRAFIPASTFKIPNALIALEAGVVTDAENPVFKWDGRKRFAEDWNKDQTLRSAFKVSAVWAFQDIARRIGPERMAKAVKALGYGNADIGGVAIDRFWLDGRLRITARQQVAFLERLFRDALPVSQRAQGVVKDIMLIESGPSGTLRGKTGWGTNTKPGIGWLVGWFERTGAGEGPAIFALNLDMANIRQAPERLRIAKTILTELKIATF